MKNKIIIVLGFIILALLLSFQSYRVSVINKQNKALETKIELLYKQNELNKKDLIKQNKELKKSNEEKSVLQAKIRSAFKEDSCVNSVVPDDFIEFLSKENNNNK